MTPEAKSEGQDEVFLFAITFQRLSGVVEGLEELHDGQADSPAAFLSPMTGMFKIAYSGAFSRTWSLPLRPEVQIEGHTVKVLCGLMLQSGADRLNQTEGENYVLSIAIDASSPELVEFIRTHYAKPRGKIRLLRALGYDDLVEAMHEARGFRFGHHGWAGQKVVSAPLSTLVAIQAFYVYAWIILIRVERDQMAIPLTSAFKVSGDAITRQGIRLLNLGRFFMTTHRTNDLEVRRWCEAITEKLRLQHRLDRVMALHEDFERHLGNASKVSQDRQLSSVSNLIFLLTILSVPISVFSALLALNLDSAIIRRPFIVLGDVRVYLVLLCCIVLVGALLGLVWLADRTVLAPRDGLRKR